MGRKISFLGLILAALFFCHTAEAKFRTDELYVGSGSGFINADSGLIEFTPMADNQIAIATDTGALTASTIEDCVGSTDALTYNAASHDIGCHAISTIAGWSYSSPNMTLTTSTDNLGIGGTPLGKMSITGDADEIQLNIRANATNSANVLNIEKSDGTDIYSFALDGTFTQAGTATPAMSLGGGSPATYPITFDLSGTDSTLTAVSGGLQASGTFTAAGNVGIGTTTVSGGRLAVMGGNVGIGTTTIPQVLTVTGNSTISGNVGIGTTTVSGGVLSVIGGNVGIGTTAPGKELDILGSGRAYQFLNLDNAIAASSNAATVPVTYKHNKVTNDSAATLTITMTTSGAADGQISVVRVYDFSAAAQTITWVNTENSTVSAPTTSNGSTTLPISAVFQYNSATSKWRCVGKA